MTSPGAVHLDTAEFAADEREAAVRDVLGAGGAVPLEIEHLRDGSPEVDLQFSSTGLGPLAVQSLRATATAFTRSARLLREDSPPSVSLTVQRAGVSTVIQEDREAVVGPGDLILVTSARPAVILTGHRSEAQLVQIPTELLAVPPEVLRQAVARRVPPERPVTGVVDRFVDGLVTLPALSSVDAERLARPTVELVRALIATVVGDPWRVREPLHATLQLRVRDYLHTHWRDGDLTAARIAAAHHISTRHVYRLLAADGISLGDWLRERRLEACRDELTRPGATTGTVGSVGRRWGFPNPTNFGRAFKAAYGLTPQEWRLLHQPAQR